MDVFLFFGTVGCVAAWERKRRRSANTKSSWEDALSDKLRSGTSRDAGELVCTVSEENIPTLHGTPRAAVRLQNLWHRATYILVRHELGENRNVVLVQRRTMLKDYCPGKLDPTPGGVVGFGESYQENAVREIQEEMGIDLSEQDGGGGKKNYLTRLFTFPYEDDRVRVWGEFYEAVYHGRVEDLKVQEEEVEEIIPLTMEELQARIKASPEDFLPDSTHALKLYFQRCEDKKVKRKLLKGYSSGDLDRYALRPKPQVIFFDCDDTLYFDQWKTAGHLTKKIDKYCTEKVGLPPGKAYELYKHYGTALRGLIAEGHLENNPDAIDRFLQEVHDLPIHELLTPDTKLREILLRMDPSIPKYIFTASVSHHARRCLQALGIDDIFEQVIIDVKECNLETKHSRVSFDTAMKIAGVDDPEACIFLDDSVTNIKAAREIGWRSVLVGKIGRDCGNPISSAHAEVEISRIHEIEHILPELFVEDH